MAYTIDIEPTDMDKSFRKTRKQQKSKWEVLQDKLANVCRAGSRKLLRYSGLSVVAAIVFAFLFSAAYLSKLGVVSVYEKGIFGEFSSRSSEYQFKHCIVKFPSGETIDGQRRLSFPSMTVFGFKIIDTAKVTEETFVTNNGEAITVVSKTANDWTTKTFKSGAMANTVIDKGDTLTFIRDGGKDVAVIGYREFCR